MSIGQMSVQSLPPAVYLLLGSNLGDRIEHLAWARHRLATACGTIVEASSLYLSQPWGIRDQPIFINQVIRLDTALAPAQLLGQILAIEIQMGRHRTRLWGDRLIDIDILFYGDHLVDSAFLTLPHPHIAARNFTLVPLMEIAPGFIHPRSGLTVRDLHLRSDDTLEVIKVE